MLQKTMGKRLIFKEIFSTGNENKKVFELAPIRSCKLKIKAQKTFNPKKVSVCVMDDHKLK